MLIFKGSFRISLIGGILKENMWVLYRYLMLLLEEEEGLVLFVDIKVSFSILDINVDLKEGSVDV